MTLPALGSLSCGVFASSAILPAGSLGGLSLAGTNVVAWNSRKSVQPLPPPLSSSAKAGGLVLVGFASAISIVLRDEMGRAKHRKSSKLVLMICVLEQPSLPNYILWASMLRLPKGVTDKDKKDGRILSKTFADLPGPELKWEKMTESPS
ncbi:hypothetical protein L1987_67217 [Smallanthus sonchifolius]|uniref:Uncharacterized protein n=1 Tax=Smallanthus sonchifolius TaxID=185202 RepID=A0ACB9BZK4_9ASTR|nr:hypothetical protein L1987_67217 [Smallanthus sonchifolius]